MFNLSKSPYQAALLKQRVNQQCGIYQTAWEKCVPSAQRAQEAYDKKRGDEPKEDPINVDPREDRLQFLSNMTMLFVAYVRLF